MKKITLLTFLLLVWMIPVGAQCINTNPYPAETIVSDNSGDYQLINSCVYTGNFSTVSNLVAGNDYTFALTSNGQPVNKYITITDVSSDNNVIAFGYSPLVVPAIDAQTVRIHYTENENCETEDWCLEALIKITLTCPFPTEIQITGVTMTNASFAWFPGGNETAWQVLLQPRGSESPGSSTSGIAISGEPQYAVNTLEAGQRYDFYVRSDCESEFSPWRGPYQFNAACTPIADFSENFDGGGDLPNCWTALNINGSPMASIGINSLSNSGPNAVQIANDNSVPTADLLLISPDLSTVAAASHRLKFFARGYGNVALQVGTINTTTADGIFHLIETVNATGNYMEYIVDYSSYEGTDTHIAFRHANTSTYNPVFIDDVRWEMLPLCPDVQDIEMTGVTQTTVTIGWEQGTADQWDVVFSETSNDPNELTPISPAPTTPEATITGLQPDTTYKAWVRSNCGVLGNGVWMNPITFTTACNAISTFNETFETTGFGNLPECWSAIISGASVFNSEVKVISSNAVAGMNAVSLFKGDEDPELKLFLVSPALNTVTTGNHRIKFFAKSNFPSSIDVGTLDSPVSGGTFSPEQTIELTTNYVEYVVDFTGYSGVDNFIGIRNGGEQYSNVYIDNIRWELTPLCDDVTDVTVNNIMPSTVDLDWTANSGETQWDVVYGLGNETDPNNLTPITPSPTGDSMTTLSGLTPNTTYNVWVRSDCGGTDGVGAWIGPIIFKSACLPTGAFSEGFETATIGGLPDCWSAVLSGPTLGQYAAVRTVNNDAAFGSNAVEIHANSSAPTDWVMLVSPYLNTLGAGTHRLKFYALSYNDQTPFEIGTMDGNSAQATYSEFQQITLGSGYNEYTVDFTNYTGTGTYIAFRNIAGNYNSTFIDNVRWEEIPNCQDVSAVTASGAGSDSAIVSWTGSGVETSWQVAYGGISVSDPSSLTPSEIITETTYNLSGLTENTDYNVWVRSVCGGADGLGAWIGPAVFKTHCAATTVPYTEDFESVSLPNLPDCSFSETFGNSNSWNTTYGDSGYGFDGYVLRYNGNSSQANAWFYTQGILLTAGKEYQISYKYGNNSSDNYVEHLQVLYGTSAAASAMVNEIADHGEINSGMAMVQTSTFTPAESGVHYIGFYATSMANQSQLFVDSISVTSMLSTPEIAKEQLSFYPNPVKDVLYLSQNGMIGKVTVVNVLGQKVLESNFNTTEAKVDVSGLNPGTYMVKVENENANKTIKVIKQ